jgi:putative component of membrane protein insertase Oxa1/YidC/SpoIIIJ protein YidD
MFFNPLFAEEPWDVRTQKKDKTSKCQNIIAKALIDFHQEVISPIDGPRSHFRPSSSGYMLNAVNSHGFFLGVVMGCDRLLRENEDPWVYDTVPFGGQTLKWDPVDGKSVLESSESVN